MSIKINNIINNLYNINTFKYQISNFRIISSDCDLQLLCDDAEYDLFRSAVTFAINYMIENEESMDNPIPDDLLLYVNKKDNIVSLKKRVDHVDNYRLTEPLQAWIDLLKNEAEMFG